MSEAELGRSQHIHAAAVDTSRERADARVFAAWRLLEEAAAHEGVSIGQLCETARALERSSVQDQWSLPSSTPSLQSSLSDVETPSARDDKQQTGSGTADGTILLQMRARQLLIMETNVKAWIRLEGVFIAVIQSASQNAL